MPRYEVTTRSRHYNGRIYLRGETIQCPEEYAHKDWPKIGPDKPQGEIVKAETLKEQAARIAKEPYSPLETVSAPEERAKARAEKKASKKAATKKKAARKKKAKSKSKAKKPS